MLRWGRRVQRGTWAPKMGVTGGARLERPAGRQVRGCKVKAWWRTGERTTGRGRLGSAGGTGPAGRAGASQRRGCGRARLSPRHWAASSSCPVAAAASKPPVRRRLGHSHACGAGVVLVCRARRNSSGCTRCGGGRRGCSTGLTLLCGLLIREVPGVEDDDEMTDACVAAVSQCAG